MNKILLAVDSSEHSQRAANTAGELSAALDIPVVVVHVVPDSGPLDLADDAAVREYARIEDVVVTQRDLLRSLGTDLVARAAATIRDAGGQVDTTEVLVGSPAKEIVSFAEAHDADCIVMGRRGLGDVGGLFMGSVSHKVGHMTSRTLITTE